MKHMNTIAVRHADDTDAEALAALAVQLGYPADTDAVRRRLSAMLPRPDYLVAVACAQDRVCAWLQAHRSVALESGSRVELLGLVVAKQMRRQGVGRLLVQFAEDWAGRLGSDAVVVRSNVLREESHAFYLALGYARTKTQAVYRKSLAPEDGRRD